MDGSYRTNNREGEGKGVAKKGGAKSAKTFFACQLAKYSKNSQPTIIGGLVLTLARPCLSKKALGILVYQTLYLRQSDVIAIKQNKNSTPPSLGEISSAAIHAEIKQRQGSDARQIAKHKRSDASTRCSATAHMSYRRSSRPSSQLVQLMQRSDWSRQHMRKRKRKEKGKPQNWRPALPFR